MTNLNQVAILATAYNYGGDSWIFPSTTSETSGSLEFSRTAVESFIQYDGSADWAVGTGPFTIEWFMFSQDLNSFPRIFSIGTYSTTASIAVSIEGGTLYFWVDGSTYFGVTLENYVGNWRHIAITRDSESTLRLYYNGNKIAEQLSTSFDVTDTIRPLYIGTENPYSVDASYRGYLTGFAWNKGEALYTGETLTVPTAPLTPSTGTKLLLNTISSETALDDDSTSAKVPVDSNNIIWTNYSPY